MTKQSQPAGFHPIRRDQRLLETAMDSYKTKGKLREPTVCPDCGAVFHAGRWSLAVAGQAEGCTSDELPGLPSGTRSFPCEICVVGRGIFRNTRTGDSAPDATSGSAGKG
jgi:hypothetical protein